MLHDFVVTHRHELIRRCRVKVSQRPIPPPTPIELDHGVPLFLDQLVAALRAGEGPTVEMGEQALLHGHDLLRRGFTVSQVVHDYGDICQAITELAVELAAPIGTDDFRMLNACLDEAIALAVTEYTRERDQTRFVRDAQRSGERLGFFAHELRNLLGTAMLAFEALRTGSVGIGGSTGAVLHRSIVGAEDLIARALAEIRLKHGIESRERLAVARFIDELSVAARMMADASRVMLTVRPVDQELFIDADRHILKAAVMNVLQNAFKFTRPRTTVTLAVEASADRVRIDVGDECGGLSGDGNELFRPFAQASADRSGLGLGLTFCRWSVEANGGTISVRNVPAVGCVFSIDLPRAVLPVAAIFF
jgi:signal transduction histidine kinase